MSSAHRSASLPALRLPVPGGKRGSRKLGFASALSTSGVAALRHAGSLFADTSSGLLRFLQPRGGGGGYLGGAFPPPPSFLCFTAPRLAPVMAVEALLSMLFSNLFWVGLWDLLDSTIFPNDTPTQMWLLIIAGVLGMYFTDSLYDSEEGESAPTVAAAAAFWGPLSPSGRQLSPGDERGAVQLRVRYGSFSLDSDEEDGATLLVGAAGRLPRESPGGPLSPAPAPAPDDVRDAPFVPPRLELRRLGERILSNVAAVFVWTGVWNQIDAQVLPPMCSADGCKQCDVYGDFPCAWYKIAFVAVGLVGLFVTRGLYSDSEVTYCPRGTSVAEQCCSACGWRGAAGGTAQRDAAWGGSPAGVPRPAAATTSSFHGAP